MASISLAALQPANFHTAEDPISYEIRRVSHLLGRSYLRGCTYSDEHVSNCKDLGTVHHLESEQDLCLRHFKAVNRG